MKSFSFEIGTIFPRFPEVQKNKWTPHYQTEFDGESEKNNRFVPRELFFLDQIPFF